MDLSSRFLYIRNCNDNEELKELYEKYKDRKDSESIYNLGCFYYWGKIIEQSYEKAIELFEEAAEMDNINAIYELTKLYQTGYPIRKNIQKAIKYYEKLVELNDVDGIYTYAMELENNSDFDYNLDKIISLYEKASSFGHALSYFRLGSIYNKSRLDNGLEDVKKAIEYYEKSVYLGNTDAINSLQIFNKYSRNAIFEYIQMKNNLYRENEELKEKIKELEKENEEMKKHISLQPDGKEFFKMWDHFKSLIRE